MHYITWKEKQVYNFFFANRKEKSISLNKRHNCQRLQRNHKAPLSIQFNNIQSNQELPIPYTKITAGQRILI
jgi:hypothetical protein